MLNDDGGTPVSEQSKFSDCANISLGKGAASPFVTTRSKREYPPEIKIVSEQSLEACTCLSEDVQSVRHGCQVVTVRASHALSLDRTPLNSRHLAKLNTSVVNPVWTS